MVKYGNRYGYTKTIYVNNKVKITIICSIHGDFQQIPSDHLNGRGCSKCGGVAKKDTMQFIKEAIEKHGNIYDYVKTIYINSKSEVTITCSIHGDFKQTPNSHLQGGGCPVCARNIKKDTRQFIKEVVEKHGYIYGYTKTIYINDWTKVIITCHIHGDFEQRPNNHLNGNGCPKCGGTSKKDTEQFIKEIVEKRGNIYGYTKTIYINNITDVIITCSIHGDFKQKPKDHLLGSGCHKCFKSTSKQETKWLDSININQKYRQAKIKINGKIIITDAYIKETNTVYEFHGNYWHGNPRLFKSADVNGHNKKTFGELYQKTLARENLIRNAGYNLIVMWEDDFRLLAKV